MKKFRNLLLAAAIILAASIANSQIIYQLQPISTFGTHGDGSVQPGEIVFDNAFNQRGMAFDQALTNLIVVDTHTGTGASDHGVGHIYPLSALTGQTLDDGFGGTLVLNTNGIPTIAPNQAYPYAPVAVADDGVVYVCNQVNNSGTTPFVIYRWGSSTSTEPPVICFSNNLVPAQRYGTSIDIRGSGTGTQIIIGSLASSSSGTNVVIFTTADGTNFDANILGADVANPNFNDGVAFGADNTFWGKQIGSSLRCFAFNLAGHSATTIRAFSAATFPDNDSLGTISVNPTLNLLAAIEEAGGNVSGGPDRVRLYDISNFSNQPPALLDVKTFPVDNANATAPMGYLDFLGTNLYAHVINNGMLGFHLGLATAPPPQLTSVPAPTNQTVVGRTVTMTVAGFPAVHYQWQSNSFDIPNQTNSSIVLVNVQTNFGALYTCVVTNSGGSTNASTQLVVVSSSSYYHLNLLWSAFPGDTHSYIQNGNGATPSTPNQRSIAYNVRSNHLYIVARSGFGSGASFSNYVFNVVDANNGNLLWTMNTNGITLGVGNGGVGLSSLAVADDGAIYACNIAPNAGGGGLSSFRVYRWADGNSNTVPDQIYVGDPAINGGVAGGGTSLRWGDSLAVRGSGTNTLLLLDNNNNPPAARYVAILQPTDSTMMNWTQNVLHQASTGTTIGRSLEFGTNNGSATAGTFWQKRNTTPFILSPYNLISPADPVPELVRTPTGVFTNALSGGTFDPSRKLLMGVSTYANALIIPDTLDLYDVTDVSAPLLLAQYNFPVNSGTNHNGNSANCINQTARSGDKVFSLDTGNGLMAFTIAAGPPTAPVFLAQPQNVRVILGGTINFSVSVDQQAAYRWQFNNVNIPSQTNASLVLTNAQLSNAGPYRVIVSNIFGMSTSAVATATVILPSDEYSLSPIWAIGPTNGNGNIINGNGGGTPFQRTITYNALSNHLYVVSRFSPNSVSNYAVYVLNASDGSLVSALNTNGIYKAGAVGESGVGLVGIGVSDDGSIYACNMTPDACGCGPNATTPEDSYFRLYRWSSEDTNSGPMQVFVGDPAGQASALRWGDNMVVRGGGTNTEILLDTQPGNFAAVLRPTDAFLTNFTSQYFANPAQGSTLGRSLQFGQGTGTNTMWQKRLGSPLQFWRYDTTNHTSVLITNYSSLLSSIGPVQIDFTHKLLAGIDFNGTASTPDSVDLYDFSTPLTPVLIAQYAFPTNEQANGNAIGQIVFAGSRVWALNGNNGLVGFNILGPKLDVVQIDLTRVRLSYTTNLGQMTIQSSPAVATGPWTTVGTAQSILGSQYVTTNNLTGQALFYRLRN